MGTSREACRKVFVFCAFFVLSVAVASASRDLSKLTAQEKLVIELPFLRQAPSPPPSPPPPSPPVGPPPPYTAPTPVKPRIPNNGGKCSYSVETIVAYSEKDLYRRLNFPETTTVFIYLADDIPLQNPLNMSQAWSCTSLRPQNNRTYTISYPNDTSPAVFIWNTNNVFLYGVNVVIPHNADSPNCLATYPRMPDFYGSNVCGALQIWKSYEVKVYAGRIFGRIDILRSARVHIDSVTAFADGYPPYSTLAKVRTPAAIRIMYCGDSLNLIRANIVISNSDVSGGNVAIWMAIMTAGVTIRNNYIHNFTFAGVQCGANVQNVADCMLTTITNNLIVTEDWVPFFGDASAIYYDTHWVNPGNYASCNYMIGGQRCYYLDYCSSGVRIDGGLCMNTQDGNKFNTGKNNVMTNVLHYNVKWTVGILSCQTYYQNNCLNFPGSVWAKAYYSTYDTPAWRQIAPYLTNLCSETSVNGVECNPSGGFDATVSGNCSGLPTGNVVNIINVDGSKFNPSYYGGCGDVLNAEKLNTLTYTNISSLTSQFDGFADFDFGVSNFQSPIYARINGFKSCPRSKVGIQKTLSLVAQMKSFNSVVPSWLMEQTASNPEISDIVTPKTKTGNPQAV